jgi:hypothetical protein
MAFDRTLGCAIDERSELKVDGSFGPTVRFDAEDAQRDGLAMSRDDAVFADNAVLFTAGNNFAGEQQQWAVRVVDKGKLIDACGARREGDREGSLAPDAIAQSSARTHQTSALARLCDYDFARANALIKSEEGSSVVRSRRNDREHSQVALRGWWQHLVARCWGVVKL